MLPSVSDWSKTINRTYFSLSFSGKGSLEMLYTVGKGVDATEAYEIMGGNLHQAGGHANAFGKCIGQIKRLSLCYAKLRAPMVQKTMGVSVDRKADRVIEKAEPSTNST